MALTCPNGHVNDEGNRFCEQCGAPLQQAEASVATPVAQEATSAGGTSSTCPVCGQENVPGTAFCDNCGAALPPPMPAAEEPVASAPAAMPVTSTASSTGSAAMINCPQCGTENDPSNRFCDNCGASLDAASAQASTSATPAEAAGDQAAPVGQVSAVPEAPPDTTTAPAADADVAPPPAEAATSDAGAAAAIDTAPPAPEAPPASATVDTSAERQRLEEEIRTQQQVIGQMEQMQASFGAATPAAILQGLDEARQKLAQAESALQALPAQPAQQTADPAEIARLEEEIRTQQQVIGQMEQMQASFGAATPAAILQGLDEVRQKLAQAESALQGLRGGAPAAAAPAASTPEVAPSAPSETAQPAPASQPSAPSQPAASQPAPVVAPAIGGTDQLPPPPAQPQVSGPRFVTRDGTAISLPRTGAEIVIGRDDPISGIHPDVDLTPHGGEAGGVSRRHAVLRETNGQWLLTDLDSTNYTRIDGNRITPDTPTPLPDGARVQFGRLEVDFHAS